MMKNSFGQNFAIFFVVISVVIIIGAIGEASEPKCIKAGCDNKQASGSGYCYLHKPYSGKIPSSGRAFYSNETNRFLWEKVTLRRVVHMILMMMDMMISIWTVTIITTNTTMTVTMQMV